jgi:predicted CXXCH cytochrome family protein
MKISKNNAYEDSRTTAPRFFFFSFIFMVLFCFIGFSVSLSDAKPTHLDKTKIKRGCSECHKNHGKRGTALLDQSKEDFCFTCHSLSGTSSDILSEVTKPSKHPVLETAQYHISGEELPEKDPSSQRHVSCYDCHNVHKLDKNNKLKGLRGYAGKGAKLKKVNREYELCYNCHADSANLQNEESDVSRDFNSFNPSYHPVETYGKNSSVPSLKREYSSSSLIACSDCHGNDEAFGPQGPHGSLYEPILRYRYDSRPGPESATRYKLCYACHNRSSILGDESFMAHKKHIVFGQISCAQCHDSHGSTINTRLIDFDSGTVFPNSMGELSFMPYMQRKPKCFLSCHSGGQEYEHKFNENLLYCVNETCLPEW